MLKTGYLEFLQRFAKIKKPLKIICDTSDGSGGPFLRKLQLPRTKIETLNSRPDGRFPAHGPNPMIAGAQKELSRAVLRHGADFGAIFDGDADRVFFLDETGQSIPSDAVAFLISKNFRPPYVATKISGYLFRRSLPSSQVKVSRAGHYFIKKEMHRFRIKFGAETSGHYYFEQTFGKRRAYYDSAIRALVEFANVVSALKEQKFTLSEWLKIASPPYASGELNFKVKDQDAVLRRIKKTYIKNKISKLDGITVDAKDFWLNVRPSHTEPLLRLNFESRDKKVFLRELKKVKKLIQA